MAGDISGWGDRFLGFAISIAADAVTLYVAAQLIATAWDVLAVAAGVAGGP